MDDRAPQSVVIEDAALAHSPAAPVKKKSSRPFAILALVGLAVLGLIGVYLLVTANEEGTDDAQVAADVVPVGARVSGQVLRVPIAENQLVKKGDLLAELDDADYAAKEQQAVAELETARANADAADAQVRVVEAASKGGLRSARAAVSGSSVGVAGAEAQVAAARAAVLRAQADLHRAEVDLARAKELRAANAVPQQQLDNASIAYDSAVAALAQAKAQLAAADEARRAAESRVGEAEGRLNQSAPVDAQIAASHAQADLAHARVKAAEAQLSLAKLQHSWTKIVAPADGLASKLGVHEGQLVQPGQVVIELVPSVTYVVANFKETQVGRMRPGQAAEVELDAFPHKTLHGHVESLSGGTGATFSLLPPDNASGNFVKVVQRVPVRIAWEGHPEVPLRAGLSAEVTVHLK